VAHALAVWLYGVKVAVIQQQRRSLRLRYTEEALERYDLNLPLLSISLPLSSIEYTDLKVRPFLDGLLPEGEPRQAIARELGLRQQDTFGLIGALGRDCAGALVIQPLDDAPPAAATTQTALPLDDKKLLELIANLREAPLGADGRVRISLAGVQEKLLLTKMRDGTWGQPIEPTPSTHILKPEIARYPHTIENEAFCLRLAGELGLSAAHVETTEVGRRKLIVVERFDRSISPEGSVTRLHQEDFCQATSTPPDQKYEEDGGPSLKRLAALLQAYASPAALDALLAAVTLNVIIGNGDAHAKNFSLLFEPSGRIGLAPLYDLMSTLVYGDDRLAMFVDNVHRTDRVTGARIMNEAESWSVPRRRAQQVVRGLLEKVPAAAEAAAAATPGVPPEILELIDIQLGRVREGLI
jgi:serine/threonine-protein kinase HipA